MPRGVATGTGPSGVDQERSTAEETAARIGGEIGAEVKHAPLGDSGRFAFAVLIDHIESDIPKRDTMHTELGDAIARACHHAKQGTTAYVYQLLTVAEPSYHLTDLREKAGGD